MGQSVYGLKRDFGGGGINMAENCNCWTTFTANLP
jgi:hypothetical protein